jgi:PAB-dependent poly(A)-specific ribonuclease subunit 3
LDSTELEVEKELNNGRLFRLLTKLSFVSQQQESNLLDSSEQMNQDLEIISLFKDYLFHQLNENGSQIVDYGHVIDCLNKLDVGSDDKILLITRDDESLLVISFKELKNCIGVAFHEILQNQ